MFYHSKICGAVPYKCPHCQEVNTLKPDKFLVLRYSWVSLLRFTIISAALFVIAVLSIMPLLCIKNIVFYCIAASVISITLGHGVVRLNIKLLYTSQNQEIQAVRCNNCHHTYLVVSPAKKKGK